MTGLPGSVAIIGLGLMGGSLARDLAARKVRVLAHDPDEAVMEAAEAEGIIQARLSMEETDILEADLVVLATPVDVSIRIIETLPDRLASEALVTDLGSTKQEVGECAEALGLGSRFVGSHPLAGDHRSGWQFSRQALFQGAKVFLCPTRSTGEATLDLVRTLWTELGATCVELDPAEHDLRMALVSHLPQVLSTAFAGTLLDANFRPRDLGPGGRDVARLAGSSPEMWTGIARTNRENLLHAVAEFRGQLDELTKALNRNDEAALYRFFRRGERWSP